MRPEPRELLLDLFRAAVARARPEQVLAAALMPPPRGRTVVVGAGKAGGAMATAFDDAWPADAPMQGLVVTRYGHVPPAWGERPRRLQLVEAAHPVPDEAGRAGAQRLLSLVDGLGPDDRVVALMSGGASALLAAPAPGLTLADKQAVNQALLASGAAIDEMNCVRKHLSAVKGGRLAQRAHPAPVHTLLISDVPGDDPSVIGSGPTVPDATTCADALAICARYGIALPAAAEAGLRSGAFETPKPGDACFAGNRVQVIATPQASLEAAAERARALGLAVHLLSDEIEGESRVVGQVHAALARAVARRGQPFTKPCVILSGGETTVTVRPRASGQPRGRGGRATEFLLGCALALQGEPGVHVLAADTDGIDGIEDNAGALVGPDTLQRAAALGLKPRERLDANDAHGFFSALGDLVHTGPTFTNVNDFRALLVL
ncbi:MAG: glycerate kinase [Rubrivivax sp.]|nr:glycerate kinase [Rubrivivax sp.]